MKLFKNARGKEIVVPSMLGLVEATLEDMAQWVMEHGDGQMVQGSGLHGNWYREGWPSTNHTDRAIIFNIKSEDEILAEKCEQEVEDSATLKTQPDFLKAIREYREGNTND